jgi:hypothetical protein
VILGRPRLVSDHAVTASNLVGRGWRELASVVLVATVLTAALTYPLAFNLGRVGRIDNGDGQFSIWNVAWVARTLVVDPLHVYDANIFYPHRWTLAYSENNLGAGALAIPAYWATRNPYFAHNVVVLLGFLLSATGMYYLVRHLTGDRRAAAVSAIAFAFCPYVFARTAHIQLLMIGGLPFVMLAFHRVAEQPAPGRGAALGAAMAAQAICCGYYGIFAILMVGFAVVVEAALRARWRVLPYWTAIGVGALTALAIVGPLFVPYVMLHRTSGFTRTIDEAVRWSADWRAYFASSAYAHAWMLPLLGHWKEVVFPGFVVTGGGLAGAWLAWQTPARPTVVLYGGLAGLACWASFGPSAGLYTTLYETIPVFAWLRAPGRFGLIVVFALSVLAGLAVAALLSRLRNGTLAGVVLAGVTAAELAVPLRLPQVPPVAPEYRVLAALPRAPLIEMPFFYPQVGLFRHSQYMLNSTAHWMPMVNGYSDYIPPDFVEHVMTLAPFPSRDAFKILEPNGVRYALFHLYGYNQENRRDVLARLAEFEPYLRLLYIDDTTRLYEIVGYPK